MINNFDSCSQVVLNAFSEAWVEAGRAYDDYRINSERCLQSFLYHGLLKRLGGDDGYKIFIEPRIQLPLEVATDSKKRRYIDTVVVYDNRVLLAVEIKYKSRGAPRADEIKKDFASLSHMLNGKTKIQIERINGDSREYSVSKETIVAFGIFFAAESGLVFDQRIFGRYKPGKENLPSKKWVADKSGKDWRSRSLPYRLYIFGAETKDKSTGNEEVTKTDIFRICNPSFDPDFMSPKVIGFPSMPGQVAAFVATDTASPTSKR